MISKSIVPTKSIVFTKSIMSTKSRIHKIKCPQNKVLTKSIVSKNTSVHKINTVYKINRFAKSIVSAKSKVFINQVS